MSLDYVVRGTLWGNEKFKNDTIIDLHMSEIILFHHISFLATILYLSQNLNHLPIKQFPFEILDQCAFFRSRCNFKKSLVLDESKNFLLIFFDIFKVP